MSEKSKIEELKKLSPRKSGVTFSPSAKSPSSSVPKRFSFSTDPEPEETQEQILAKLLRQFGKEKSAPETLSSTTIKTEGAPLSGSKSPAKTSTKEKISLSELGSLGKKSSPSKISSSRISEVTSPSSSKGKERLGKTRKLETEYMLYIFFQNI